MLNKHVMDGAYEFTSQIAQILVEKFNGKVMGSDDLNYQVMMQELWGDYGKNEGKEEKYNPEDLYITQNNLKNNI